MDQRLGDPIRVVELAAPDEREGAEDGRPPLHRLRRARQTIEDVPRLVDEVHAHDVDRAAIDEIPRVDPVVSPDVQVEQLAPPVGRRLLAARLPVHDADRADADGVIVALEQPLDLGGRHGLELERQLEDLAHADSGVGSVALSIRRAEGGQASNERIRRQGVIGSHAPSIRSALGRRS